jgi:hypothetical protein
MLKLQKQIVSLYPPIIVESVNHGRCVIYNGVYYPVKNSFTTKEAMSRWKKWTPSAKQSVPASNWTWKVPNSKGTGYYDVSFDSRGWSCTCTGFGFRRKCRHTEEKAKLKF